MTPELLSRIDWMNHDGVNLAMINDFVRNQFYDRILSESVSGRDCVDIGFGTGLLSIMALKHGARHVVAFESDHNRFELGQEIINRLGLKNQIELIHARYDHTRSLPGVIFTETVNGNLWNEGLWNSLPREPNPDFLPGCYFLEIWAVTVPQRFAQGLCRPASGRQEFNPAVDVPQPFVELINQLRGVEVTHDADLPQGLVTFERQQVTDWEWVPYMRAIHAGSVVGKYTVSEWQPNTEWFEICVDTRGWSGSTVLVVPRMGMAHGSHRIYLDTGHWGPGENPVLLVKPRHQLQVRHNVKSGVIEYELQ